MSASLSLSMPWDEYTSGGYLGSSALHAWGKTSLEQWSRDHLEAAYSGSASRWTSGGSYLDQLVSGDAAKKFAVKPAGMNFSTKEGNAWRDEHSGLEIIEERQKIEAEAALPIVRRALDIMQAQLGGSLTFQATLRGEVNGVKVQTRPDMMIGRRHLPDLKYVNPDSFDSFDRNFAWSRYAIQTGLFYGLSLDASGEIPSVWFLLVESGTTSPRCRVVVVPDSVARDCWTMVQRKCQEIADVRDSERGFVDSIVFEELRLTDYAKSQIA